MVHKCINPFIPLMDAPAETLGKNDGMWVLKKRIVETKRSKI